MFACEDISQWYKVTLKYFHLGNILETFWILGLWILVFALLDAVFVFLCMVSTLFNLFKVPNIVFTNFISILLVSVTYPYKNLLRITIPFFSILILNIFKFSCMKYCIYIISTLSSPPFKFSHAPTFSVKFITFSIVIIHTEC